LPLNFNEMNGKFTLVIEKNQFRGEYFKYLYQIELEVDLLPTPRQDSTSEAKKGEKGPRVGRSGRVHIGM